MTKTIRLRRGLDIQLEGEAQPQIVDLPVGQRYALIPDDMVGVIPKPLVKAGDDVKAGTPLFFDKNNPELLFTSPVSGVVESITRGDKRKILDFTVKADKEIRYEAFSAPDLKKASHEEVVKLLLASGLWPMLIRRPYGVIAKPDETPKAIFVSGFDSAPLAPDMAFALQGERENLQAGFDALKKLTDGAVHLSLRAGNGKCRCCCKSKEADKPSSVLEGLQGIEYHYFNGPHPAGNVGVQIHHIDPVNKGEAVWTVNIQDVAIIGRLMLAGKVDMRKVIALAGSEVIDPKYYRVLPGAQIRTIAPENRIKTQAEDGTVRIISGNVLTGRKAEKDGYLGFYANMVTVIPEGDHFELLGWAMPRFHRFSVSGGYLSWLTPKRKYALDTNLNGGERAYVVTGLYDKYVPMDIYPMYLIKAALAGDIDKMENLGIYEVIEEDFALCEFVDPSKTDIQEIIRGGLDLMQKELG